MQITLRDYQVLLVEGVRHSYSHGHRAIVMQAPTGAGKSVMLAFKIHNAIQKGGRVVLAAHRTELVDQLADTVRSFGLDPVVLKAGDQPGHNWQVMVAMIQTLKNRAADIDPPTIFFIDEAHHATAATYVSVIEAWPDACVIGVTATPARLDGKPLKDVFDDLVLGPSVRQLINLGALADYEYLAPVNDELAEALKGMRSRGGDYAKGELESATNKASITGDVIKHYLEHMPGMQAICFCVTVEHARDVAQQFREAGITAGSLDGTMSPDERSKGMESFRDGSTKVLTSCEIISEGLDVPGVQGVILLRPTQSITLYLQQVGRALRPKEDGSSAIILDHVGNVFRHGMPCEERAWTLEGKLKRSTTGVSTCPKCYYVKSAADPRPSECPTGMQPKDSCPLATQQPGKTKRALTYRDGKLVRLTPPKVPVTRPWAGNIDIKHATGASWQELLRIAGDNKEKLEEIAKIRGLKPGWVYVRQQQLSNYRRKYRS